MLNFPKTTKFNKVVPKQKFYENITISATQKRVFIEQIKTIYWRNKIASTTLNIAVGESVTEIEIFEIKLKQQSLDESVLKLIDKEIPYHIIFLLEYESKYKACLGYKEVNELANKSTKVNNYYSTEWLALNELPLKIEGLNLDVIYENFLRKIAGQTLEKSETTETLKQSLERDLQKKELQKQIEKLETKIRKEKQFNKQVQMYAELKRLKKSL